MPPNGYIELSTDSGTTYKAYDVEAYTGLEYSRSTPFDIQPTLDGTTSMSVGVSKALYSYTLIVRYSGQTTGYGTISDLASAVTSAVAGGLTAWKLKPMLSGTATDVVCLNFGEFAPELITPTGFASDSYYRVAMQFMAT